MEKQPLLVVDQNKIRFAMFANLVLLASGWVFNSWIPLTVAALSQLLGATELIFAPYFALYNLIFIPVRIIKPYRITDDPVPHRFASLIGGILTLFGIIFLLVGVPIVGWVFIIMVFTLQNLNLWVNFCMMYSMYYLLYRLSIPGFTHAPIKNQ